MKDLVLDFQSLGIQIKHDIIFLNYRIIENVRHFYEF